MLFIFTFLIKCEFIASHTTSGFLHSTIFALIYLFLEKHFRFYFLFILSSAACIVMAFHFSINFIRISTLWHFCHWTFLHSRIFQAMRAYKNKTILRHIAREIPAPGSSLATVFYNNEARVKFFFFVSRVWVLKLRADHHNWHKMHRHYGASGK